MSWLSAIDEDVHSDKKPVGALVHAVMIPPMVGPTWSRVAYSLGSDYVLVVVLEDLPRGLLVVMCYLVRSHCVVCHVLVPPSLLPLPAYLPIR